MSLYQFIACEYELPALRSPKIRETDGGTIIVESEDDLGDLEIYPDPLAENYSDIPFYTKLPYIYSINLEYTEERCQRLYDYLTEYCRTGQKCEIWMIWLGDYHPKDAKRGMFKKTPGLHKISIPLKNLTIDQLKPAIDDSEDTPIPSVLLLY